MSKVGILLNSLKFIDSFIFGLKNDELKFWIDQKNMILLKIKEIELS